MDCSSKVRCWLLASALSFAIPTEGAPSLSPWNSQSGPAAGLRHAVAAVATAAQAGPLRVHPINPRYFTDGSGNAVYLTGSHTWGTLCDYRRKGASPLDFKAYLEFLKRYNHNFGMVQNRALWGNRGWTLSGRRFGGAI